MKKSTITINTIDGKSFQVISEDPGRIVDSLMLASTGLINVPDSVQGQVLKYVRREHISSVFVS